MQFIDLNRQYKILEQQIDQRIKKVLQHSQFILGNREVNELRRIISKVYGVSIVLRLPAAQMLC